MTSGLVQDFNERSIEVGKYFLFLRGLENGDRQLTIQTLDGNLKSLREYSDWLKTLKASGFILLYNLLEATMRNAIQAIFDELQAKGVSYDQIRPELKKIVLKYLNKRSPDEIFSKITDISLDIITVCFDREDLFSGNIDGQKIRKTAQDYGFSYQTNPRQTNNGIDLFTVKTNRNDLAHGLKSFAEVGREHSANELTNFALLFCSYGYSQAGSTS